MSNRLEELKGTHAGMLDMIVICLEQIHYVTAPNEYRCYHYGDDDQLVYTIERQLCRLQNFRKKRRALEEAIKEEESKDVRV